MFSHVSVILFGGVCACLVSDPLKKVGVADVPGVAIPEGVGMGIPEGQGDCVHPPPGNGTWDIHPHTGHHHTYGWKVGGSHPTGILSCELNLFYKSRKNSNIKRCAWNLYTWLEMIRWHVTKVTSKHFLLFWLSPSLSLRLDEIELQPLSTNGDAIKL